MASVAAVDCSKDNQRQPVRVMLWSFPRSCTTVFARSIEALGDAEIFWEPFVSSHFYGPERRNFFADSSPHLLVDKYTYAYVRDFMEGDFPGTKILFAKDMTKGIVGKYEYIPQGYRHSFLIRDPRKTFPSLQRLSDSLGELRFSVKAEYGEGYRELADLEEHIRSTLGKTVVIDADDVLAEPERILPKYCRAVGLEYDPKMLHWEETDVADLKWHFAESMEGYERSMGFFTNALLSTCFVSPKASGKSNFDESNWSMEVKECIAEALPFYEKLHEVRLKA